MKVHRCPFCKKKGRNFGFNLKVLALVPCDFTQLFPENGNKVETTSPIFLNRQSDISWSGESEMTCQQCDFTDKAVKFVSEYFPNSEPLVTEHTYSQDI